MMSDAKPDLILIGLRACGKSTIGRLMAQRLGVGFVDLDDVTSELLESSGAGEAIETHGIEAFREAEGKALASVLEGTGRVIALGGGTPTADGCAAMLKSDGCRVVYLRALAKTLCERLKNADNVDRPALVEGDVVDEVETLFEQRDGLYRELAESVIHVDGVSEEAVLGAVLAVVKADQ